MHGFERIARLLPPLIAEDHRDLGAWLAALNRRLAFLACVLLAVFAVAAAVAQAAGGMPGDSAPYPAFAVGCTIGGALVWRRGSAAIAGVVLAFATAVTWVGFEVYLTRDQDRGLAAFTIAIVALTLFRHQRPLAAIAYDLAFWVAYLVSLAVFGMRADPVMSSFFVVCAAFPIQVRLYRGACAEYRNDALIGELEQRNRELADLSTTDALSGAQNRRGFEDSGADWMEGAGPSVALILFDIDHFKAFNDEHGHPAGDATLRAVAAAVREVLPAGGRLFRLGGEEFAVLERGDLDAAQELAARMLDHVRTRCAVTISLGVAAGSPGSTRFDELYAAADEALYRAKRTGRDRVATAG